MAAVANDGIVTASGVGETTITASIGPIRGQRSFICVASLSSVEVFPPTTALQVADHVKFDGRPYDADGNALPGRLVRWASENNSVASVDTRELARHMISPPFPTGKGQMQSHPSRRRPFLLPRVLPLSSPRRSRSVVAERLAIAQQPFAFFSEIIWSSSNRIPRRSCLRET